MGFICAEASMRGWVVFNNGAIEERELRWVDDETVRCGAGTLWEKGTWALIVDSAKFIAEQMIEKQLKVVSSYDPNDFANGFKRQLREMRGEGKYVIKRMGS